MTVDATPYMDICEKLSTENEGLRAHIQELESERFSNDQKAQRALGKAEFEAERAGDIENENDQLRARIRDLEAIVAPLAAADDMWTDYGSGFRLHFSFGVGANDDVVANLNAARATQKSGETDA